MGGSSGEGFQTPTVRRKRDDLGGTVALTWSNM